MGRTRPRHLTVIVAATIGAALTGCAAPGPGAGPQEVAPLMSETASPAAELFEDGTAQPYTGPYDADFAAQIGTYPQTGRISDYEGVEVSGTVHAAYNVPTVEENLGEAPEEDALAHYDGEPFVLATAVNSPVPTTASTTTTSG